jgi:uncharacterized membrane protein YdjX (TVP38/TMEM64 family)
MRGYPKIVGIVGAGLLAIFLVFSLPGIQTVVARCFGFFTRGDLPALRAHLRSFGPLTPLVAASLMLINAFVPVFPSLLLTIINGMLFGPIWGTTLSWSSSMLGAAGGFLLARHFGRPWVERWVGMDRLRGVDHFFEAYGAYAVLLGRLIPVISFKALNFGLGLTPIRFWLYWGMTGLGMIPATILYSVLGDRIPALNFRWWWGIVALLVFAGAIWYGARVLEKRGMQA